MDPRLQNLFLQLPVLALILVGCDDSPVGPGGNVPTPTPSQFDWTVQPVAVTGAITDIFFVNSTTGWAIGDELVMATSNGGADWPTVPVTKLPAKLNGAYFIDMDRGWMVGGESGSETGEVFVSQQGGAYPEVQKTVDNPLNSVFFLDSNFGWAIGENGVAIKTDDGGVNWTPLNIAGAPELFDLHFLDSENGWVVTDNGGLYRTSDGLNLIAQDVEAEFTLRAIHFVDTLHGWACGDENTILRRHLEAGNTVVWSSLSVAEEPGATDWSDIYFLNSQTGWLIGSEGKIYKTTDGGITWTRETVNFREDLNAIHMVSESKGWIAADQGVILTYTP